MGLLGGVSTLVLGLQGKLTGVFASIAYLQRESTLDGDKLAEQLWTTMVDLISNGSVTDLKGSMCAWQVADLKRIHVSLDMLANYGHSTTPKLKSGTSSSRLHFNTSSQTTDQVAQVARMSRQNSEKQLEGVVDEPTSITV